MLPYFKRAETNARGANEWHGDSGPIVVKPSQLDLPICDALLAAIADLTPGKVANCRSSGCATDAAMMSGLAPGRLALTLIVGKSTVGRAATGSKL